MKEFIIKPNPEIRLIDNDTGAVIFIGKALKIEQDYRGLNIELSPDATDKFYGILKEK